ncbi:MAG: hypothetical protein LW819_05440 [Fimbriimonadaceae bacterium]|jgi:hypothetical protein|nr:hypothetical protein [Fimbriimonadaceae bacterium]
MKWTVFLSALLIAAGCSKESVSGTQTSTQSASLAQAAPNFSTGTWGHDPGYAPLLQAVREYQEIFDLPESTGTGRIYESTLALAPQGTRGFRFEASDQSYSILMRNAMDYPKVTSFTSRSGGPMRLGQRSNSRIKTMQDLERLGDEFARRLTESSFGEGGRTWVVQSINWRNLDDYELPRGRTHEDGLGIILGLNEFEGVRVQEFGSPVFNLTVDGHTGKVLATRLDDRLFLVGEAKLSESECRESAKKHLAEYAREYDGAEVSQKPGVLSWGPAFRRKMVADDFRSQSVRGYKFKTTNPELVIFVDEESGSVTYDSLRIFYKIQFDLQR